MDKGKTILGSEYVYNKSEVQKIDKYQNEPTFLSKEWLDKYIDKGLHYAIRVLNEKGYKTSDCCEGHYSETDAYYMGAYIRFAIKLPNKLFPKTPTFPIRDDNIVHSKYKTPIMEIGSGHKQKSDKPFEDAFYWTGTRYKRVSREEKDREHEQLLREINEWADSLPPYESLPKELKWDYMYMMR